MIIVFPLLLPVLLMMVLCISILKLFALLMERRFVVFLFSDSVYSPLVHAVCYEVHDEVLLKMLQILPSPNGTVVWRWYVTATILCLLQLGVLLKSCCVALL